MAWSPIPPAGEIVDVLLRIALPAALLAGAVPLLLARSSGGKGQSAGLAIGCGLGLVFSNFLRGSLPWTPNGWGWSGFIIAWFAVLLGGGARTWLVRRRGVGLGVGLAACLAIAWLLLPGTLRPVMWAIPALALAAWGPWIGTPARAEDSKSSRRPGAPDVPDVLVLMTLALAGSSVVLIHAHSARLMDVALMAASALAGGALAAGWYGSDGQALWGIPFVTLPALMLVGWSETSSEVPKGSFILAGLAAWPLIPIRNRTPPLRLRLLRGGLVFAPVLAAVVLAMRAETLEF